MNQANYPAPSVLSADPWRSEIGSPVPGYMTPPYPPQSPQHRPAVPSTVEDPHLHMTHGQTSQIIQDPQNRDEVYLGSLKAMLGSNVGNHIIASFLAGSQNLVRWEGILYDVGNNYVTIYQEDKGRYVVGDLYSLKFMEFYEPRPSASLTSIPRPGGWQDGI